MALPKRLLIAHADPQSRARVRRLAERRVGLVATAEADSFDALLIGLQKRPKRILLLSTSIFRACSGRSGFCILQ